MKQKVQCDEAEMKALADVVPVKVLRDNKKMATYAMENKLNVMQVARRFVSQSLGY